MNDAANTVISYEVSRSALGDLLCREFCTLDRGLDELRVVLYDGVVLKWVQKDHFALDND